MKKIATIALILVLAVSLLTGCFGRRQEEVTVPSTSTTQPTTRPATRPATQPTMPDMEDMIPGTEDTVDPDSGSRDETIDPTNGANREEEASRRRRSPRF